MVKAVLEKQQLIDRVAAIIICRRGSHGTGEFLKAYSTIESELEFVAKATRQWQNILLMKKLLLVIR